MTELKENIDNSIFHAARCLVRKVTTKKLFRRVGLFALGITAICWQTIITLPIKGTIVADQLTITSQPLPQTDCYGNHVEFSVGVTGSVGTVSFQWQQRPPGGNFSDISGATGALLSIDNIGVNSQNINGTEYRVLITDESGTISSDPALLSINSITSLTPVVVNSIICSGGSITYKVFTEGNVTNNGYQWSWNNGSGWILILDGPQYSGTTSSQLTISNATTAQSGSYRVSVTFSTLNQPAGDPTCIETSFTRERNLLVRDLLLPPVVSSSQQICYGNIPSTLTGTPASGGSGPNYTYQWQKSTDGYNWTDVPAANALSYSPPVLTATTYYRIVAGDGGTPSCGPVNSGSAQVTVNPIPTTSPIYHR
ncbi:MAG: hypothetical protein WA816_01070 [Bacteroidales bacterium]